MGRLHIWIAGLPAPPIEIGWSRSRDETVVQHCASIFYSSTDLSPPVHQRSPSSKQPFNSTKHTDTLSGSSDHVIHLMLMAGAFLV